MLVMNTARQPLALGIYFHRVYTKRELLDKYETTCFCGVTQLVNKPYNGLPDSTPPEMPGPPQTAQ